MGKRKNNFSIARRSLLANPNELKDICLFISGVKKWILGIFDNLSQNFESFRIYCGLCLKCETLLSTFTLGAEPCMTLRIFCGNTTWKTAMGERREKLWLEVAEFKGKKDALEVVE